MQEIYFLKDFINENINFVRWSFFGNQSGKDFGNWIKMSLNFFENSQNWKNSLSGGFLFDLKWIAQALKGKKVKNFEYFLALKELNYMMATSFRNVRKNLNFLTFFPLSVLKFLGINCIETPQKGLNSLYGDFYILERDSNRPKNHFFLESSIKDPF